MMAGETTIVISGATGDLAQRKLMPALFNLACKGRLPQELRIVGFARSAYSDDAFRDFIWQRARDIGGLAAQRDQWEQFARRLFYVRGDVSSLDDFAGMKKRLEALASGGGPSNYLFYLSIAPQLYETAVKNLGASGLAHEETGWRRVVIEKPFGMDLRSSQNLNRVVHEVFKERRVFRIDHYLGKETVQNILAFRFANTIFEPLWNRDYIDNIQITVAEKVTVADRAAYYDQSGVVRDMVQNHLLQILTMVAMEPPSASDAESLRDKKMEVLRAIRRWAPDEIARQTVRGQYRGYLQEKGVAPDSPTPTFAALRLQLENRRWQGVPFYLRTGKAMREKVSEIVVQFRPPPHMVLSLGTCQNFIDNALGLCLQPDEGVHVRFDVKVPDQGMCLQPVDMAFHYASAFRHQALPEAYERLLQDALEGDASLFIRSDHIEEAWRVVDPLLAAWADSAVAPPLHAYEPGSWGPAAADALLAQEKRAWMRVCRHGKG